MAYIKERPKPKCGRCLRPATHDVYNRKNAMNGEFCLRHARQYCAEISAMEAQYDKDEIARQQ